MEDYKIQIPYLEGLQILLDNTNLILSRKNSKDENGYSKIYFDTDNNLSEEHFEYDDCLPYKDGIKKYPHIVCLENDFLYLDGWQKENVLFFMKKRWNVDYDWHNIYVMLSIGYLSYIQKDIAKYLKKVYDNYLYCMNEKYFDISKEEAIKLHEMLEEL